MDILHAWKLLDTEYRLVRADEFAAPEVQFFHEGVGWVSQRGEMWAAIPLEMARLVEENAALRAERTAGIQKASLVLAIKALRELAERPEPPRVDDRGAGEPKRVLMDDVFEPKEPKPRTADQTLEEILVTPTLLRRVLAHLAQRGVVWNDPVCVENALDEVLGVHCHHPDSLPPTEEVVMRLFNATPGSYLKEFAVAVPNDATDARVELRYHRQPPNRV